MFAFLFLTISVVLSPKQNSFNTSLRYGNTGGTPFLPLLWLICIVNVLDYFPIFQDLVQSVITLALQVDPKSFNGLDYIPKDSKI